MEQSRGVRCQTNSKSQDVRTEVIVSFDTSAAIDEHLAIVAQVKALEPYIAEVARRMISALSDGGKVLWMGNGGSAADSQHLAAELVGRFARERRGLASLALTTDTSVLTALANDFSFENVFSRQIEALCCPQDLVIAISTSGNSKNVIAGISAAKRVGAFTVALTGEKGKLGDMVDTCIRIPSRVTARVQEAHILIGHILCDWVESEFVRRSM